MCKLLLELGAEVCGYALKPEKGETLFKLSGIEGKIKSIYGDIRDLDFFMGSVKDFRPDIMIHMAAQPIVRESYKNPVDTYGTNVMGTVNMLEAVRRCSSIRSVVNVTTDKVYQNNEQEIGYCEDDVLNGYDPYSNSKSCSELVTSSYSNSFLRDLGIGVSTCRAGNVLGGGDFAVDRIIPDCYAAVSSGKKIVVRNPDSVRPYQHVLDPVCAYLMVAHRQYEDLSFAGAYNIGPDGKDNIKTGSLVEMFCRHWGNGSDWTVQREKDAPHEAKYLYLNCEKAKRILGWKPIWGIEDTIAYTVQWYQRFYAGDDMPKCMEAQIGDFMKSGGQV
mgnify:CR=1 FL=1